MKLLVSACLLGVACRYDGRSKLHPLAQELCRRHEVIPVCGEIFGGLPTPRLPSERREGGVFASDGGDVTDACMLSSGKDDTPSHNQYHYGTQGCGQIGIDSLHPQLGQNSGQGGK